MGGGVGVGWLAICVATTTATVGARPIVGTGVESVDCVHPANPTKDSIKKAPTRLIQPPKCAQGDGTPDLLTFQSTVADAVVCRTSHSLLSSSTVYVPLAEAMNE